MSVLTTSRKPYLTAVARKLIQLLALALVVYSIPYTGLSPVQAQVAGEGQISPDETDAAILLKRLKTAEQTEVKTLESQIKRAWSRSGSASADLLLKRGRDALRAKKPKVAIEHLTALTDHAPEFAEGWHMRASAYYQEKLYGPALEDLARTLALNPDHFEAIQGLGAIFEQLGDQTRAYEAYAQVLTIHPNHAGVLEAMERLESQVKGPEL